MYKILLLTGILFTSTIQTEARTPLQFMKSDALSLEYCLNFRGQMITERDIASNETMHLLKLGYSPLPFVAFFGGLGINKFTVDPFVVQQDPLTFQRFDGGYGFSPAAGGIFFTPRIAGLFRAFGGIDVTYIYSKDAFGKLYEGPVYDPGGGLTLTLAKYLDVALGGKGHLINGKMKDEDTKAVLGPFSNRTVARGYLSVILKSPYENKFLSLDFEASPDFTKDWTNGPRESAIMIAVGILMKEDKKNKELEKRNLSHFPGYKSLEDDAEDMRDSVEETE
jgi:hypothetical protein